MDDYWLTVPDDNQDDVNPSARDYYFSPRRSDDHLKNQID